MQEMAFIAIQVKDYWTFTPLERPDEFGERGTLTDEEAATFAQEANAEALARDLQRQRVLGGVADRSRQTRRLAHRLGR